MHPFLLGLYIVLRLVAGNLDEVGLSDAVRAILVVWLCTALATAMLSTLLGNRQAAAITVTLGLTLLFSFDATLAHLGSLLRLDASPLVATTLLIESALLIMALFVLRRHVTVLQPLTRGLNVMTLALLVLTVGELTWFAWRAQGEVREGGSGAILAAAPVAPVALRTSQQPLRDIYLIVLDGYTRSDVLRNVFGGDNSRFIEALENEGFLVATDSHSNYLSTKLVLPSLLNMRYLDDLVRQYGPNYPNVRPLVRDIQHNRVVASLRQAGYRIVNIQSDVDYAGLAHADEIITWEGSWWQPNALETALIDTTPLRRWRQTRAAAATSSPEARRYQQVRFNLRQLGAQGDRAGPKFVFAHIMSPHQPFVFDRDGGMHTLDFRMDMYQDYDPTRDRRLRQAYADQVQALDRLVLDALRDILQHSTIEPIIILMGDHGLRLYVRDRAEDSCLQESFAILYALRLPGDETSRRWFPRTPVNTFRSIFDLYFDTGLGPLPDRALFAHRRTGYYTHHEVTSEVETCNPAAVDSLRH